MFVPEMLARGPQEAPIAASKDTQALRTLARWLKGGATEGTQ